MVDNLGSKNGVPFMDIKGLDYVKEEFEEIVDFLKSPSKYRKFKNTTTEGNFTYWTTGSWQNYDS